jgi:FlaA1/EpsC-like NDP-sugar epimerase
VTYRKRITALVILDSFIVLFAIYISYLTFNPNFQIFKMPMLVVTSLTLLMCHHLFAFLYKLYNKSWQYASIGELVTILKVATFSVAGAALLQNLV